LKECKSLSLTKEELQRTDALSQDLTFLLTPQPWETMTKRLPQSIGKQFTFLRQSKGIAADEMAKQLEIPLRNVRGVGFEYTDTYATPFQTYLSCLRFLGVNFRDVFENILKSYDENDLQLNEDAFSSEDEIKLLIEKAVQAARLCGKIPTRRNICQTLQLTGEELFRYPWVKTLLLQMVADAQSDYRQRTK